MNLSNEQILLILAILLISTMVGGIMVLYAASPAAQAVTAMEMTKEYAARHTYMPNNSFVCSDMAIDLWNMMKTEQIDAYIAIGNIDANETPSLMNSTHAWVVGRFGNMMIAFEPQTGDAIHEKEDVRYFNALIVNDSVKVKEFYAIYDDYKKAEQLLESSKKDYEMAEKWYKEQSRNMTALDMDYVNARVTLESQYAIYKERERDVISIIAGIENLERNMTILRGGETNDR